MEISEKFANGINYYTLQNDEGMSVTVMDWGATITAIKTHDKNGKFANIVLGFDNGEDYITYQPFYGASVARVAGRIKNGRWGDYQLSQNDGDNQLHGGNLPQISFEPWYLERKLKSADQVGVVLQYITLDGENGYPGTMTITANFILDNHGKLTVSYTGKSDKETLFNPTNHTYFNLTGDASETIDRLQLRINADEYAQINRKTKLPTGKLPWVTGTPYDFHELTELGPRLKEIPDGLDTPFVLNDTRGLPQLELLDRISGRKVAIHTNANSMVVFSSTGFDDDRYKINGGKPMRSQLGLAIEPQMLPDAIHHKDFGNIVIPANHPVIYQNSYYFTNIYDV